MGTYGTAGCFSFQASKNLNSGEGGAISPTTRICASAATLSQQRQRLAQRIPNFSYNSTGSNLRMTEFQAALLIAQMTRIEAQAQTRTANAQYLTSMLKEIPGIAPARMYDGCTRNAYHLYMFRYDQARFAGLPRAAFLKALAAEGVPGERRLPPAEHAAVPEDRAALARIPAAVPGEDAVRWEERNRCPANDRLCEEAVWFTQTMLLAPRESMDSIADAIRKIQVNAERLLKA